MDDREHEQKPGVLGRLRSLFPRAETIDEEEEFESPSFRPNNPLRQAHTRSYQSHVTVRRNIKGFEEAYAAGAGLKRGEIQIVNLTETEPGLRRQIRDFLSGVSFAEEGHWAEIAPDIYLITPHSTLIDGDGNASIVTAMGVN